MLQVYKCSFYCFAALVQAQLYSMTADHVTSFCALFQQLRVDRDLELFVWDLELFVWDPGLKTLLLLICCTHTLMAGTYVWVGVSCRSASECMREEKGCSGISAQSKHCPLPSSNTHHSRNNGLSDMQNLQGDVCFIQTS